MTDPITTTATATQVHDDAVVQELAESLRYFADNWNDDAEHYLRSQTVQLAAERRGFNPDEVAIEHLRERRAVARAAKVAAGGGTTDEVAAPMRGVFGPFRAREVAEFAEVLAG